MIPIQITKEWCMAAREAETEVTVVDIFLKNTRQWWRAHRIAHAKASLGRAKEEFPGDIKFWNEVLKRLGG